MKGPTVDAFQLFVEEAHDRGMLGQALGAEADQLGDGARVGVEPGLPLLGASAYVGEGRFGANRFLGERIFDGLDHPTS